MKLTADQWVSVRAFVRLLRAGPWGQALLFWTGTEKRAKGWLSWSRETSESQWVIPACRASVGPGCPSCVLWAAQGVIMEGGKLGGQTCLFQSRVQQFVEATPGHVIPEGQVPPHPPTGTKGKAVVLALAFGFHQTSRGTFCCTIKIEKKILSYL